MIPELYDGVLPEGMYRCTIDEIEKVFGRFSHSDKRPRLTEKLKKYVEDARNAGIATAIIVDGSYITAKAEPSDIDLILVLRVEFDLSQEVNPFEYNIQSKRRVRRFYGFDVLPATEGSETYKKYVEFFSRIKLDDPEQKTSQRRKGLLRIDL